MIRINLAPPFETEDRTWYVKDLVIILVLGALSFGGVTYYFSMVEDQMQELEKETALLAQNKSRLKAETARYEEIKAQLASLNQKIASLDQITVSKITRYKPIILLEQVQLLKPKGLWLTYLRDDTKNNILELVGGAFDNRTIAHFMTALEAIGEQDIDDTDLRTQVFFQKINLVQTFVGRADFGGTSPDASPNADKGQRAFPELTAFPKWQLNLEYQERTPPVGTIKPELAAKEM